VEKKEEGEIEEHRLMSKEGKTQSTKFKAPNSKHQILRTED
jgi:hypothetical protein